MKRVSLLVICFFITGLAFAQGNSKLNEIYLFQNDDNSFENVFNEDDLSDVKSLLKFDEYDITNWWPTDDNWTKGTLTNFTSDMKSYKTYYISSYIQANEFSKSKLKINSNQMYRAFLNGKEILKNDAFEANDSDKEISLEVGKHLLVVKIMTNTDEKKFEISLEENKNLNFTLNNKFYADVNALLNDTKISSVSISYDGKYFVQRLSKRDLANDKNESWIEIRELTSGKLVNSLRGLSKISRVSWSPVENSFFYTTSNKEGSRLWMYSLENNLSEQVFNNIKDFGSFYIAPNGVDLIYSKYTSNINKPKLKRFKNPEDRFPGSGGHQNLFTYNLETKKHKQITTGKKSYYLSAFSPDSKKIIVSKSKKDFTERPFSKSSYYILDLATLNKDSLFTVRWGGGIDWSPDGKSLLVSAGPITFGKQGENIDDDQISNSYDGQLYFYDLASKEITPITIEFNPSVTGTFWLTNNRIYLTTIDESYNRLYAYDINSKKFSYVDLDIEALRSIDISVDGKKAICFGSSSNIPNKVFSVNFEDGSKQNYKNFDERNEFLVTGKVEDLDYYNDGKKIKGRVYFPPNYDKTKKYPTIVYYYAGTSPVTREFEGRYPKNIWAANGYLVYILQPSGAYGFGQKFSAMHTNDWGKLTADDIIKGTNNFINKYQDVVDEDKLGCIGASYGGFMTMNLITKTDVFAAAISHAGISALTSYWGEGFWGYTYSAVATAESYPWNRKDIYVDHSPIYNAEKINTPLLLLHGNGDTNVPPGESIQMYTALKVLGKDVEYIEVDGQNHHIMEYHKRMKWTKTIIAYFNKYLKGDATWFDELYK